MASMEPLSVPPNARGSALAGRDGTRTVVWVRGEHDIATSDELSDTFAGVIASHDADLVVDLSEVQFMDASTIGVIVRASNLLAPRSRSLSLRSPAKCARRVLDMCGLAELIEPDPPASEVAGALGTWVAVPVMNRADDHADGSTPVAATTAKPADSEQAGQGTTALAGGRGR